MGEDPAESLGLIQILFSKKASMEKSSEGMKEERNTCQNKRPTGSLRTCLPLMNDGFNHLAHVMAQRCLAVTRPTALPPSAPHWLKPTGVTEASECVRLTGVLRVSTATLLPFICNLLSRQQPGQVSLPGLFK